MIETEYRQKTAWWTAALVLVLSAIAVRFALNFSHPFPPAVDAGYYPMQTRAWLLRGKFVYDDLPLLFWLDAAAATTLMAVGQSIDAAVLTASRVIDCVAQPWTALFIAALGREWSGGRRRAILACTAAAIPAVLSPPVIRMLSDFQKNSLGLVWMAGALWALRRTTTNSGRRNWLLLALFLVLAALTHIGAFAITGLAAGITLLTWIFVEHRGRRPRAWELGIFLASAAVLAILLLYFEAERAKRMFLAPFGLLWSGPLQTTPAPVLVLGAVLIGFALRRAWRDRESLPAGDRALVVGLAATTLFLILPKNFDYYQRLVLMAPLPASLLMTFVMARRSVRLPPRWTDRLFTLSMAALAAASPPAVQGPLVDETAAAELREFRSRIENPASTLIVAPHGLEWWAGFFLDTPVRANLPEDAFSRYARVLALHEVEGDRAASDGPPGRPPVSPRGGREGLPAEGERGWPRGAEPLRAPAGLRIFQGRRIVVDELSTPLP